MDPITVMGAFASIIDIVNFLKDTGTPNPTPEAIERVFNSLSADSSRPESRLKIEKEALQNEIRTVLAVLKVDKDFLDRINKRCLRPFQAKVNDEDVPEVDLEEARGVAAKCVCENINMARKLNGNKFPNDEFRRLWEQFGCGSL